MVAPIVPVAKVSVWPSLTLICPAAWLFRLPAV